jgi:hypothetical protein
MYYYNGVAVFIYLETRTGASGFKKNNFSLVIIFKGENNIIFWRNTI